MKIPDSVKIGAHDIKLVVASHWKNDGGVNYGEWISEDRTIYLHDSLKGSLLFATLLHEAMHVMNSTIDHVTLDSMAEQVSQFLLDNGFINTK